MQTIIPIENGDILTAVRGFLGRLFEHNLVEALYLPMETGGGAVVPALVTNPARLEHTNPLAPVMPINGARAVSALTGKRSPARLGAVLRSCEIRALIELVKLEQASLDGLLLIGIDCPGTYEVTDYVNSSRAGRLNLPDYLSAAREGCDPVFDGVELRPACQMCTQPVPSGVAISFQLFGADLDRGLPIQLPDELAAILGFSEEPEEFAERRSSALEPLLARHSQARERELMAIRKSMDSNGGLNGLFATCIRCHNCMTVCPICYCKTCLFKTAAFDHQPEHYLHAARRKGATRMLGDTLLFQMTRLNHMSASCVSCGMCTSACPSDIPVGAIFSAVGAQVQATFDYAPGKDAAEPLPLITFQASEWTEIGE